MLPLFYSNQLRESDDALILDEETSKHIVQVLRIKKEEQLELTDGKGNAYVASIIDDHKKKVVVKIEERKFQPEDKKVVTIAISLLKNANRFEWFLEKATEIGVAEIVPMICERTERQHFRSERMQNILISAMLQSRQFWMPRLGSPLKFQEVVSSSSHQQKFIAHCIENEKKKLQDLIDDSLLSQIILIGPEGDFTNEEVSVAMNKQFLPVTLGENRLRAETAGVVAATLTKIR
jgi:16S rRNA (uracil1498-N3)-methyltransferase